MYVYVHISVRLHVIRCIVSDACPPPPACVHTVLALPLQASATHHTRPQSVGRSPIFRYICCSVAYTHVCPAKPSSSLYAHHTFATGYTQPCPLQLTASCGDGKVLHAYAAFSPAISAAAAGTRGSGSAHLVSASRPCHLLYPPPVVHHHNHATLTHSLCICTNSPAHARTNPISAAQVRIDQRCHVADDIIPGLGPTLFCISALSARPSASSARSSHSAAFGRRTHSSQVRVCSAPSATVTRLCSALASSICGE